MLLKQETLLKPFSDALFYGYDLKGIFIYITHQKINIFLIYWGRIIFLNFLIFWNFETLNLYNYLIFIDKRCRLIKRADKFTTHNSYIDLTFIYTFKRDLINANTKQPTSMDTSVTLEAKFLLRKKMELTQLDRSGFTNMVKVVLLMEELKQGFILTKSSPKNYQVPEFS